MAACVLPAADLDVLAALFLLLLSVAVDCADFLLLLLLPPRNENRNPVRRDRKPPVFGGFAGLSGLAGRIADALSGNCCFGSDSLFVSSILIDDAPAAAADDDVVVCARAAVVDDGNVVVEFSGRSA